MAEPLVCVGGEYDGQSREPYGHIDYLILSSPPKMVVVAKFDPSDIPDTVTMPPHQVYQRETIGFRRGGQNEYLDFWRHESLTAIAAVRLVFKKYRERP